MGKLICTVGGVISGVGKGVSAASIGLLLKMRGERVQLVKFDPYLNSSASLIRPGDHGETFITDKGDETDLDLGTYERITGIDVSGENICTSGTLFSELLQEEREGKYLGDTIQFHPHLTNKIITKILELLSKTDILCVEIGGSVEDIECSYFMMALQQLKRKLGNSNFILVHVAPVIYLNTTSEFKTKPLQKSIIELQKYGLFPDILLCRTDKELPEKLFQKISDMAGIPREYIFDAPDAASVYEVPIIFYNRHIDDFIADRLHLKRTGVRIRKYKELVEKYSSDKNKFELNLAIVGKYVNNADAYLSLKEAVYHSGVSENIKVNIRWIDSVKLEDAGQKTLTKVFDSIDAVIVPGGFDNRGIEGKIKAIQYVREKNIPFLGICLGLQCAVIEFCRNVLGIKDASSEEFTKDGSSVIHYIEGKQNTKTMAGTLRLGAFDCELDKNSISYKLYQKKTISERHRHRYEVNSLYVEKMTEKGFKVKGIEPKTNLVEIMELEGHPFFVGIQAHPEFKSRLNQPSPLFVGLLNSARLIKENKNGGNETITISSDD